ncbi:hypothetical protein SAMN05421688_3284 [Poseidonocella pacifica]|uniref:Uncharacterized protein n=1 Tax=Poseidonocella pacifica TaxID=871651 RepID=A0A1I0YR58_9RHOB|nr:tetratricopeptide repeat protein [Poseidonocella pacifica]SFB15691.1 hypothetical protein SAMN05421688_3284 [Poseidonocella pacifica]
MSNTDSFIDEVSEEVRRDRLYGYLRRYGWVAVVAILVIVGGAAYNEYRKSQAEAQARELGDATLTAMQETTPAARAAALQEIAIPEDSEARAVIRLLEATEANAAGDAEAAAAALNDVANDDDLPAIYRDIARFRALTLEGAVDDADRRMGLEALAVAGNPLRVLAEEQIALMDLAQGDTDAARDRFAALIDDAEASDGLRNRATQAIVALGGLPEEDSAGSDSE